MREFNLSKKQEILEYWKEQNFWKGATHEAIVKKTLELVEKKEKEFIRLLKENLCDCSKGFEKCYYCETFDKLAGDKLI